MNVANSTTACPSCFGTMGVDADNNYDGTGVIYEPAKGESVRCAGCEVVICASCAAIECGLCGTETKVSAAPQG